MLATPSNLASKATIFFRVAYVNVGLDLASVDVQSSGVEMSPTSCASFNPASTWALISGVAAQAATFAGSRPALVLRCSASARRHRRGQAILAVEHRGGELEESALPAILVTHKP